jgi:hypothetical protein
LHSKKIAAPATTSPDNLGMPKRRFRVLAVGTHPVPYQVSISRRMAAREDLDVQVAYQDFVLNAYLRLLLGGLFCWQKLAQAAQTSSGGDPQFDRGTR